MANLRKMDTSYKLKFLDRDRTNLLGLMLGRIVENNLVVPKKAARARKMKGRLGVTAGRMSLTMEFSPDALTILPGIEGPLKTKIGGSFDALLRISLGEGLFRSFFAGEITFSGNPFFALRALPLFRVETREESRP